ncbi:hypothetical protein D9613_003430 [Agrocybe pediades]|uniref:Uncharacterized protein n=1 Tax=Agrocybe pediades TaxID=84607 RepID=A0A8H4QRM7_9AGAR|nr:hypothetical protein D9613_003430 [Agrocybe pediades]
MQYEKRPTRKGVEIDTPGYRILHQHSFENENAGLGCIPEYTMRYPSTPALRGMSAETRRPGLHLSSLTPTIYNIMEPPLSVAVLGQYIRSKRGSLSSPLPFEQYFQKANETQRQHPSTACIDQEIRKNKSSFLLFIWPSSIADMEVVGPTLGTVSRV